MQPVMRILYGKNAMGGKFFTACANSGYQAPRSLGVGVVTFDPISQSVENRMVGKLGPLATTHTK